MPLADKALRLRVQKYLSWLNEVQWKSPEEIAGIQKSRLTELLLTARSSIPYYRHSFANLKIDDTDIKADPYDVIKYLPLLDKQIIKENLPNGIVKGDIRRLRRENSSGSSGIQGTVYMDRDALSWKWAAQTLKWQWAGYEFGNPMFQTGMSLDRGIVKRIKDIVLRTTYAQAFQLNPEMLDFYMDILKQNAYCHLCGYASSLFVLADWAQKHDIGNIAFDSVISLGDKLFPHYRTTIEEVFNTEVYDTYGCAEGLMISGECNFHRHHIISPHVFVEILDENCKETPDGELGSVVVTRLDNFAMPLIRYRIGDLAIKEPPEEKCNCGRGFPLLRQIIGRDTDIVRTPEGDNLIVHFFTGIFEHYPEIKQFQVVQKRLDSFEIRYIPSQAFYPEGLNKIREQIYQRAGKDLQFEFIRVNTIKDSPSGKPQIVVSEIGFA